jgi:hypothetical protein
VATPTPGAATATPAGPSWAPLPTPAASPTASGSPQTDWTLDLFETAGVRHQNPDATACTAASAQTALNLLALNGVATQWLPTTSYEEQESILQYERANMTLPTFLPGSDPHGTRNALNYYGWGSMAAGVYTDAAYTTFSDAAGAVVSSIARTHKPAIVFAWMGGHAQVVTGYKVHGSDPATSSDFTVLGVYVTDPLIGTGTLDYDGTSHEFQATADDTWVSVLDWKAGPDAVKWDRYWQPDSTLRDPIDGRVGRTEWYNRWVVVLATR